MLENELLYTILMEEAGEVIQAASKILRFGRDQVNTKTGLTSQVMFISELNDFLSIVKDMQQKGLLPDDLGNEAVVRYNQEKLKNTLGTSRRLNRLTDGEF